MLEDKFNLLNQLFENDKQQEAWKLLDSTFEIIVKGDIQTKWITQFHNILLFQLKDSLKDGKDSIEKRIKIIESYFVHDKLILFSINNLLFYIKLQLKEKESQRIITTCLYLLNQIVINIEFEAILEKNKKNKSFVIALTDTLAFLTDKVCSWNIFVNEKWSFGNKRTYFKLLGNKISTYFVQDYQNCQPIFTYFILKLHRLRYLDLFLDGFINNIKKQQKGECLGSILAIKEFKLINIELILMILNLLKGNNKEEEKEEDIERLLNQNEFDDKNINNSIIIGLFYELKDKKDVVQEHLFKNGLFKVIMKENFKLKIVNLLVNFMSYLFKNSSNSNNVSQLIELILNSITIQQLNDYNFMNQIYFVLFKSIKQNSNINLSSSLTNTFFIKIMEQPNNFIKYNYFILLKFINNNKLQLELNFKLFNNNNLIYYEYLFGKDENIKIENIENKSLNDNEIKIINNKEDNDPFDSDEEIESEIDINTILNNNNNNNNLIKEPRNLVELIEYFKEKENVEYNQLAIQHMKSIIHNSDLQQLNKESQQLIKILLKLENNDDKKREEELALRKEMIVYILKKSFYSCIDIYLQFILEDKLNLFNTLIAVDGLIDLINSIDNLQQQQQQQQTINNNNNNQIGNLKWKSKNILLNQTNNKSILTNNNNNKLKQGIYKHIFLPLINQLNNNTQITIQKNNISIIILNKLLQLNYTILLSLKYHPNYEIIKLKLFNLILNYWLKLNNDTILYWCILMLSKIFLNIKFNDIYFLNIENILNICQDIITTHTNQQLISLTKKCANLILTQYQAIINID